MFQWMKIKIILMNAKFVIISGKSFSTYIENTVKNVVVVQSNRSRHILLGICQRLTESAIA